jgi:hypothetical protein
MTFCIQEASAEARTRSYLKQQLAGDLMRHITRGRRDGHGLT